MHQLLLVNEEPFSSPQAHLIPVSGITGAALLFEPTGDSNGDD